MRHDSNWHSEACDKPCRRPGESFEDLAERLEAYPLWAVLLHDEEQDEELGVVFVPRPQRFVLTVAHLDHVPENCDRRNLKALCAPCHCRMDLAAMATKKRLKAERLGQLNLGV